MSKVHGSDAADTRESSGDKQPWLTPRRSALLASALLLLVVTPLVWAAVLLAVPVFVHAFISLAASRERTIALVSSGLAVLAPVAFLVIFA